MASKSLDSTPTGRLHPLAALGLGVFLAGQPACFGQRMEATAREIELRTDVACRVRGDVINCANNNYSLSCQILDRQGEVTSCELDVHNPEVETILREELRKDGNNCVGNPIVFTATGKTTQLTSC